MRFGEVVETKDGSYTIHIPELDECYHSHMGALAESRVLYVEQSGFSAILKNAPRDLSVFDVGLGLGYNALSTIEDWLKANQPFNLNLFSLEYNSDLVEALTSGTAPWATNWSQPWLQLCSQLQKDQDGLYTLEKNNCAGGTLSWRILIQDGQNLSEDHFETFMNGETWDYIWQDPFSPKKNPAMWSSAWFKLLKVYSKPQTRLVTYSVARAVRDNLAEAGWNPEKIKAESAVKRQWLLATPN